jgi:hypothetical protein
MGPKTGEKEDNKAEDEGSADGDTPEAVAVEVTGEKGEAAEDTAGDAKRKRDKEEEEDKARGEDPNKKVKAEFDATIGAVGTAEDGNTLGALKFDKEGEPAPVGPSKEGTSFFNDSDVLSGRGGGTNVHPGRFERDNREIFCISFY